VCPWAALAAHHQEVPHVWFVREYGDLDHGRVFEIGRKKTWEDVGNLSALVVANSQALASHVKKYINGDKVTVLYNPFSLEDISKKASENVPNPYKHKDSLKLILTSGSLTTSKGVAEAVEATAVLNKEGFLAELCLVGREDNKEYLRSINKTIKECGIVDKVHFTGWQKNPLAYVKYADAGIMSSRREAFGRVTFEYIAIGKPVIGTNAGGTPELVRNGVNGFLFERGDTASLVGCLRKYAEDTGLAKTHGQNSLKRAKEIISSQYNADNTYKKLKSITSKKQKYSDNIHYETKLTDYGKLSKEAGKRRLLKTTKQALRSKAGAVYRFSRSTARKALKERKYVKR
jgi:glycosyltransferase involved in cell wall biosynthesis